MMYLECSLHGILFCVLYHVEDVWRELQGTIDD